VRHTRADLCRERTLDGGMAAEVPKRGFADVEERYQVLTEVGKTLAQNLAQDTNFVQMDEPEQVARLVLSTPTTEIARPES
jgi:hypothetical protein